MKQSNSRFKILFFLTIFSLSLEYCGTREGVALDPESKDFYEYCRLIMTKQEKEIFNLLPDKDSRWEFIQDFWDKRDPDPQTEENEFQEEFYQRIQYVNKHFTRGVPGWKTDRGRIFIYLGAPDKIEQRPFINDPNVKGLIWWGYYRYGLGIEFIDRTGDGSYTLSRQSGRAGGLLDAIEKAKFGQIWDENADRGKIIADFDVVYDVQKKEIFVTIPAEALSFEVQGNKLIADFSLEFYVYSKKTPDKDRFTREKSYETTEDEALKLEEVVLSFPYDLTPGDYYFDVLLIVEPKIGKFRKIFRIKVQ
jgi:GWxTD domain-containing protein